MKWRIGAKMRRFPRTAIASEGGHSAEGPLSTAVAGEGAGARAHSGVELNGRVWGSNAGVERHGAGHHCVSRHRTAVRQPGPQLSPAVSSGQVLGAGAATRSGDGQLLTPSAERLVVVVPRTRTAVVTACRGVEYAGYSIRWQFSLAQRKLVQGQASTTGKLGHVRSALPIQHLSNDGAHQAAAHDGLQRACARSGQAPDSAGTEQLVAGACNATAWVVTNTDALRPFPDKAKNTSIMSGRPPGSGPAGLAAAARRKSMAAARDKEQEKKKKQQEMKERQGTFEGQLGLAEEKQRRASALQMAAEANKQRKERENKLLERSKQHETREVQLNELQRELEALSLQNKAPPDIADSDMPKLGQLLQKTGMMPDAFKLLRFKCNSQDSAIGFSMPQDGATKQAQKTIGNFKDAIKAAGEGVHVVNARGVQPAEWRTSVALAITACSGEGEVHLLLTADNATTEVSRQQIIKAIDSKGQQTIGDKQIQSLRSGGLALQTDTTLSGGMRPPSYLVTLQLPLSPEFLDHLQGHTAITLQGDGQEIAMSVAFRTPFVLELEVLQPDAMAFHFLCAVAHASKLGLVEYERVLLHNLRTSVRQQSGIEKWANHVLFLECPRKKTITSRSMGAKQISSRKPNFEWREASLLDLGAKGWDARVPLSVSLATKEALEALVQANKHGNWDPKLFIGINSTKDWNIITVPAVVRDKHSTSRDQVGVDAAKLRAERMLQERWQRTTELLESLLAMCNKYIGLHFNYDDSHAAKRAMADLAAQSVARLPATSVKKLQESVIALDAITEQDQWSRFWNDLGTIASEWKTVVDTDRTKEYRVIQLRNFPTPVPGISKHLQGSLYGVNDDGREITTRLDNWLQQHVKLPALASAPILGIRTFSETIEWARDKGMVAIVRDADAFKNCAQPTMQGKLQKWQIQVPGIDGNIHLLNVEFLDTNELSKDQVAQAFEQKLKAHLEAGEGFWIPRLLPDGSLVNFDTLLSQLGPIPGFETAPYHIGNVHKLRASPNAEADPPPGGVAADETYDQVLAVLGKLTEGKSPVAAPIEVNDKWVLVVCAALKDVMQYAEQSLEAGAEEPAPKFLLVELVCNMPGKQVDDFVKQAACAGAWGKLEGELDAGVWVPHITHDAVHRDKAPPAEDSTGDMDLELSGPRAWETLVPAVAAFRAANLIGMLLHYITTHIEEATTVTAFEKGPATLLLRANTVWSNIPEETLSPGQPLPTDLRLPDAVFQTFLPKMAQAVNGTGNRWRIYPTDPERVPSGNQIADARVVHEVKNAVTYNGREKVLSESQLPEGLPTELCISHWIALSDDEYARVASNGPGATIFHTYSTESDLGDAKRNASAEDSKEKNIFTVFSHELTITGQVPKVLADSRALPWVMCVKIAAGWLVVFPEVIYFAGQSCFFTIQGQFGDRTHLEQRLSQMSLRFKVSQLNQLRSALQTFSREEFQKRIRHVLSCQVSVLLGVDISTTSLQSELVYVADGSPDASIDLRRIVGHPLGYDVGGLELLSAETLTGVAFGPLQGLRVIPLASPLMRGVLFVPPGSQEVFAGWEDEDPRFQQWDATQEGALEHLRKMEIPSRDSDRMEGQTTNAKRARGEDSENPTSDMRSDPHDQ